MTLKQKLIKFAVEHIDQLAQTTGKTVIGEPFENQAMFPLSLPSFLFDESKF